jgi:hypothetical protein
MPTYCSPNLAQTTLQYDVATAIQNRDLALRALQKAFKSGKRYEAEGMSLQRYDIDKLRDEYVFWRDQVIALLATGTTSTMSYRRVIPLDT